MPAPPRADARRPWLLQPGWLRLALALLAPAGSGGLLLEGWVPQQTHFQEFLGKFVIQHSTDTHAAEIVTKVHPLGVAKIKRGTLFCLVYDDEADHWQSMKGRWETSTCQEKVAASSWHQEIVLLDGDWNGNFTVTQRLRPRFWYFMIVGCGVESSVPLRYSVHVTNAHMGWQREVSFDHKDMVVLNAWLSLAFIATTLLAVRATRSREASLKSLQREHPYLQLLLCSLVASSVSCCLCVLHDYCFIRSGLGSRRLRFLASMASTIASSTLFLVVMLASTGWAITTGVLPCRRVFLSMVAAVGGLSALCQLNADSSTNQSSEFYTYQSAPGLVLLALKVFTFLWFCVQLKVTYDEEWDGRRRNFYRTLAACTALLALNTPVGVILSFSVMPWWRYRVVATVDICALWVGQASLALLFFGSLSPISPENSLSAGNLACPDHGDFGAAQTEFQSLGDERPSLSI